MSAIINFEKKIPNKNQLEKVTSTEFTTFRNITEVPNELTVQEFFSNYERLFFDIPVEGEFDSHEYLVRKSGELASFEKDTSDIEPLLDEIALLRERVLQLTLQNIELQGNRSV